MCACSLASPRISCAQLCSIRYGGPQSQYVTYAYQFDWIDYLASSMGYIIVQVDGRGTNYKGRKFRNPVKDDLGHWEIVDQINAARIWAAKDYVDSERIGIWGRVS